MGILQCFMHSDLRSGHDGLGAVARKHGINVETLVPGQFVVFINSSQDRIKVYAARQVIAYLRMPKGRIDLDTIREIPTVFQGHSLDYDKALAQALTKKLAKREQGRLSPLIAARKMKEAGVQRGY